MKEVDFAKKDQKIELQKPKKRSEQLEEEITTEQRKFLSIIAHDIKTPMSSVIGFLDWIKGGVYEWDRDKIEENITIALNSAERTYSLLNSLLEWANADNIFKSYQPEELDLPRIINEEIENAEIFSAQKHIYVKSLVLPNEKVLADKNMVKSILRNLITNAIKYSYKSGKIVINTKRKDTFLEITIKDFGVGMDTNIVNTLFTSRNYLSTLGTESEPGTGYGLLLCKELVEINKGKIWIVGDAEKGSEFKFTLPLVRHTI